MNTNNATDRSQMEAALAEARAQERRTGERRYVARSVVSPTGWEVTDRMPMGGEWYTTDGIRHG